MLSLDCVVSHVSSTDVCATFQDVMAPPRRSTSSIPASPSEVPEQSGSDKVCELRAQVVALSRAMQRQEEQIERLHELEARQAAVATPVPQDPPAPVAPTPAMAAAPVTAIPPTASGFSTLNVDVLEVEKEWSLAVLTTFKKFNPLTFNGDDKDPCVMEPWLTAMEALFEDIYTLERD